MYNINTISNKIKTLLQISREIFVTLFYSCFRRESVLLKREVPVRARARAKTAERVEREVNFLFGDLINRDCRDWNCQRQGA